MIAVWPPLPPGAYLRRPARELPFPLEERNCTLFDRARNALARGLALFDLGPGDEVIAPAYHHGIEISTLAAAGVRPVFYEATEDLVPDPEELDRLCGERTRALYLTHYLGFPQDSRRWRRWCDERGLLLIEDAAMAWPVNGSGGPVGTLADIAIFSPWKVFGLRDTGALLARRLPPAAPPPRRRIAGKSLLAGHRAWLAATFPRLVPSASASHRRFVPEVEFAVGDTDLGPSASSVFLLRRLWSPSIVERRRSNYRRLLAMIGDRVPPPFAQLPPGAFPLAFPVSSRRPEPLLDALAERGIGAFWLWAVPHPRLPVARFPAAAARRAGCAALPVHQELRPRQLEAIAAAVEGSRAAHRV